MDFTKVVSLNLSAGGTVGGDLTVSGDLTVDGNSSGNYDEIINGHLDLADNNILNVGDISLDTISSDAGTSINVVLGSDSGDDFLVDTDKLVVEGDTGNVGIGTASPSNESSGTLLHIADTGNSNAAHINMSGGDGANGSQTGKISFSDPGDVADAVAFITGRIKGSNASPGGEIAFYSGIDGGAMVQNFVIDSNSKISLSNNDSGGTGGTDSTSGNTALGYLAGNAIASGGIDNTLVGHKAGTLLNTGTKNVAIGNQSLSRATSDAAHNVAVGFQSLNGNFSSADVDECVAIGSFAVGDGTLTTDASGTVAIGYKALTALTSGIGNVAMGFEALDLENDGDYSTAVGYQALSGQEGVTGEVGNTAVGYKAGLGLGSSTQCTAVGNQALYTDDDSDGSTAIGAYALNKQNGGTGDSGNTGVGRNAGMHNVTGVNNTYVGFKCGTGSSGESNSNNTAVGKDAMTAVTTGASNVAVGTQAGTNLTSGLYNTVVGAQALYVSADGDNNTAIGYQASYTYEGGDGQGNNTAVGFKAMRANATAENNTAVGALCCEDLTGTGNVAMGREAMLNATSADYNVVIGRNACGSGTLTGNSSVIIGTDAANSMTGGNSNVIIGAGAAHDGNSATGSAGVVFLGKGARGSGIDVNNEVVIGNDAIGQGVNTVMLGNGSVHTTNGLYCYDTGIASPSDVRIKKDIKDSGIGLDFIKSLRTVTYKRMHESEYPDEIRREDAMPKPDSWEEKTEVGLISQEVKAVMDEMSIDMQGHSVNPSGTEHIKYVAFVTPLIKAVQELSSENEDLKKRLEALEAK